MAEAQEVLATVSTQQALAEIDALCADLHALHDECRVRAEQIALARCYWNARRIADGLRAGMAA